MTAVEHTEFASPLTLVDQWRGRADGVPLRELVILGFTLDLPFLERFLVPQARQLGARITVVTDADQVLHDAVDVRFAGHAYQVGAVSVSRAFHPKLAVLVGDEDVWAAVGSGNPTMAGWGHNHELWAILRGGQTRGLRAQAELGAWLRALAAAVPMPSWIAETIDDVGSCVVPVEIDESRPDVRVLHNLDVAILDQLPTSAVEVNLAAPFVDPAGAAVRAVVDRARPARVRVALQRDLGSFDGRRLVAATGRTESEFREIDPDRTLHGKLIEHIDADGAVSAVVGSANITGAALLRTVADGGNCELAISGRVENSLLPDAPAVPAEAVVEWNPAAETGTDPAGPVLRLLGARLVETGLQLELLSPATVELDVETSQSGAPGSWEVRGAVPASAIRAGRATCVGIDAPEAAGTAVRLVAVVGGARLESTPAFVTDPRRCRPRADVGDAPQLRQAYGVDALITDPDLADRFAQDLLRLLDQAARHRSTTAALRAPSTAGGTARTGPRDGWTEFLDVAAHTLGSSLVDLAFPGALPSPSATAQPDGWAIGIVEDETELAEGEDEEAIEGIDPVVSTSAEQVPREARGRYRRWMGRWVKALSPSAARPPLHLRMTVAALYLKLIEAGVWGADETWRAELAEIVTGLVADPDEIDASPSESHAYLSSVLAVCLAVLQQGATVGGGRPADIVLTRAWDPAHAFAVGAQDAVIDGLILRPGQDYPRLVGRDEVDAIVKLAQATVTDPLAEVVARLSAAGIGAVSDGPVWTLRGSFGNPVKATARAATELFVGSPIVVVTSTRERGVVMVRDAQRLAFLDTAVPRWRMYALRPPLTPESLLGRDGGVPTTRETFAMRPVPATVVSLGGDADIAEVLSRIMPERCRPPRPGEAWHDWNW